MDFNRELEQEGKTADVPETLTSMEAELLLSQKRDTLYKMSVRASVAFFIITLMLIVAFKMNEDFFDANSRFGLLMESVKAQEENASYQKINVKAQFDDQHKSQLVIPLGALTAEDIIVREEFTKNKLMIRLVGASEMVADGITLTSDSQIMDAVGIYRQNLDVVVEVYCRDTYSYVLDNSGNAITVTFFPLRSNYDAVAVIYLPYEDRNRLAFPEWQQSIARYASDNRIRIFMASNMQEPYTQQEIIEFAREIDADVVLGMEVSTNADIQQTSGTAICNTTYFISDFNSAQLSVIYAEAFLSQTQFPFLGFEEADERTPLVYEATCPASMIKVSQSQKDAESVEAVYKLNENLVAAIIRTLSDVYTSQ